MNKICTVIPAFNVEPTISAVITRSSQFIPPANIIVIDDGSFDQTAVIAKKTGAVVLQNEINRGKGYSLKRGFHYAIENNYEAIVTLDGDLQHDPLEIPKFIDCYERTDADLILGDRTKDFSNMPLDRQFSNKMTSLMISLLTGQRVKDSQTGYRLIRTDILERIKLISNRYETESELLVKALLNGHKIAHVPIKTIYNNQPSHIHRLIDTLRFLKVVGASLIKSR
jgi:glycosyltransferase involved in cell wall biosynthesis